MRAMRYERIEVDWRDPRCEEAFYIPEPEESVEQAEREAEFIRRATTSKSSQLVLDLGCGPGLHSLAMSRHGMHAVALDQSIGSLSGILKRSVSPGLTLHVLRADIEALPFKEAFDLVYMLRNPFHFHTSLTRVLKGIRLTMRARAWFAIALYNKNYSAEGYPEVRWQRTVDGFHLVRKEIDDAGVLWETDVVIDVRAGEATEYVWWTQRYSLEEALLLLKETGLEVEGVFGGFEGEGWAEGSRIIMLVGRKV